MAIVRVKEIAPFPRISSRCAPAGLRRALHHLFVQVPNGLWLVGGTALAGYYAEHRRSDDLDLFANDAITHSIAVAAVKALPHIGAMIADERRSPTYYRVTARLSDHTFAIAVVMDEYIHSVGTAHRTDDQVWVPDFSTLFAMKVSTLVSRCTEKDLFDLDWCFTQIGTIPVEAVLESGATLDGGLTTETLLISLHGAVLREEACGFVLGGKSERRAAYRKVTQLRKQLIERLLAHQQIARPSPEVTALRTALKELHHRRKL